MRTIAVDPQTLVEACRISPKRPEGNQRRRIVPYDEDTLARIAITHEWAPGVSFTEVLEMFPKLAQLH